MSVSPIAPQRPSPSDHSRVQHDDAAIAARPARAAHGDEIAIGGRGSPLVSALLAHVPSADRKAAQTAIPAILEAARSTGTADPNRLGYLLATAQTESDFGANMTETGHSRSWFNAEYGGACDCTALRAVPLPCTPGAVLPLRLPASFCRSKL